MTVIIVSDASIESVSVHACNNNNNNYSNNDNNNQSVSDHACLGFETAA